MFWDGRHLLCTAIVTVSNLSFIAQKLTAVNQKKKKKTGRCVLSEQYGKDKKWQFLALLRHFTCIQFSEFQESVKTVWPASPISEALSGSEFAVVGSREGLHVLWVWNRWMTGSSSPHWRLCTWARCSPIVLRVNCGSQNSVVQRKTAALSFSHTQGSKFQWNHKRNCRNSLE